MLPSEAVRSLAVYPSLLFWCGVPSESVQLTIILRYFVSMESPEICFIVNTALSSPSISVFTILHWIDATGTVFLSLPPEISPANAETTAAMITVTTIISITPITGDTASSLFSLLFIIFLIISPVRHSYSGCAHVSGNSKVPSARTSPEGSWESDHLTSVPLSMPKL